MKTEYEIHPFALCWSKPANYEEIKTSIKQQSQLVPITLYEGKILDGVQRYRICCELGLEPRVETPAIVDPFSYVLAQNKHRRHLTKAQISIALAAMVKLQPGSNQYDKKSGLTSEVRPKTMRQLAAEGGISISELTRARYILQNESPEVIEAVKRGEVSTMTLDRKRRGGRQGGRQQKHAASNGSVKDDFARKPIETKHGTLKTGFGNIPVTEVNWNFDPEWEKEFEAGLSQAWQRWRKTFPKIPERELARMTTVHLHQKFGI